MTVAAVDGSEDKAEAAPVNGSLLGKFGSFKSIVAKKPKSEKAEAA